MLRHLLRYKEYAFSHVDTTVEAVVAQGGGPQPGGVVHPPNPGGWLLGEVQAIPQIYS